MFESFEGSAVVKTVVRLAKFSEPGSSLVQTQAGWSVGTVIP